MWKTGHSLIKKKMKEVDAALAGEMSGHMFFADRYFGFDDAIYASCRLLEILSNSGKTIPELLEGIPATVVTPEIRVDCPDEVKFTLVEKVKSHLSKRYSIIDVDGVRVLFDHGWGLVRASNTQPALVLRFEAETEEQLEEYRQTVEQAAKVMDEYKQRLSEVLVEEVEKIKQEAEQEAAGVVNIARETAEQITSQARLEAEEQAVAYRNEMKLKAEREAAAYAVSAGEEVDRRVARALEQSERKAEERKDKSTKF